MTPDDRDTPAPVVNGEPESRSSYVRGQNPPEDADIDAQTAATDRDRDAGSGSKKHMPLWQETILLLAIALVLAVVIKALFVQAFYIPSESMEPGLIKNDRILVQKVSYWGGGSPQRGDVVVFKDPGGWLNAAESAGPTNPLAKAMAKIGLYPQGGHLVKRVIGVEGDVIHCCDDQGRIEVNGQPLNEDDYVNHPDQVKCRGPMTGNCEWTAGPVPAGHIFVMGDNRARSADSSAHLCTDDETDCNQNPYVPVDLVVGKVFVLLWPADRFGFLHRPDTFDDVPDPQPTDQPSGDPSG